MADLIIPGATTGTAYCQVVVTNHIINVQGPHDQIDCVVCERTPQRLLRGHRSSSEGNPIQTLLRVWRPPTRAVRVRLRSGGRSARIPVGVPEEGAPERAEHPRSVHALVPVHRPFPRVRCAIGFQASLTLSDRKALDDVHQTHHTRIAMTNDVYSFVRSEKSLRS